MTHRPARQYPVHVNRTTTFPQPTWSATATPARSPSAGAPSSRRPSLWRRLGRLALAALVFVGLVVALAPQQPSVEQYLAAAATARQALRYDRALSWYQRAAAIAPADARPACQTAGVLLLQGEGRAAVAAATRCAALSPRAAAAQFQLGEALAASGQTQAAVNAWQRARALGSTEALRRLARLAEEDGRLTEADVLWAALPSDDGEALLHRGLLAFTAGHLAVTRADLLTARATADPATDDEIAKFLLLAIQPLDTADHYGQLGYTLLQAGAPQLALRALQQGDALDSGNGAVRAYLGWAEWIVGQRATARQDIAAGLRLAPSLSFACFAAGEVAAADGDPTHALALFQQGLDLDPHNATLWAEASRMSLALHQIVAGELAAQNASGLSRDPEPTAAWLRIYIDTHIGLDNGRAQAAATTSLRRFPRNATIWLLSGKIFDLLHQPDTALAAFTQAQQLAPTDPAAYLWLGRYNENNGDDVAAALDLRIALALRPHGPDAQEAHDLLAPLALVAA